MNFIPGLELNKNYYLDIVKPIISNFDKSLVYSATLSGYGSDVIGYDNATSMDHNWGPRLQIYINSEDFHLKDKLSNYLSNNLPLEYMGFPTNFSDLAVDGTQSMQHISCGEVHHLIEIFNIDSYIGSHYDGDDFWVASEQTLLEVISGEVFHDGLNKLIDYRDKLKYFPNNIRKEKLKNYWDLISEEEAFIGRAVENEDFIGLKIITARINKYLLKICFVLNRKYVPYSKWFTLVFKSLELVDVESKIKELLSENCPEEVENKISELYLLIIELHNRDVDLPKINNRITNYYGRQYKVIMADKIVELLK
ncbi:MAG: DUF4037 domain-containing protein [Spirochaetaceae bacterium]